VEATRAGKLREIRLLGLSGPLHWEIASGVSPSGRYLGWYSGSKAWRADLVTGKAQAIDFAWPRGEPVGIQPDDAGRLTLTFRHPEGQLYEVEGRFP
jgi:hypothetical protein